MTPEWLTAVASIGTFVVIAATAIAAVVQLRHLRSSNQIAALNALRGTLQYEDVWESAVFVINTLPKILEDPAVRSKIAQRMPLSAMGELDQVRKVGNFFETLGTLVKGGTIDARLACDLWGDHILRTFQEFIPLIANIRAAYDSPATWENFEYLAMLVQDFDAARPQGTYPKNSRRATLPKLWPEVRELVNARAAIAENR